MNRELREKDELDRALDQWQAPQPGAALDERISAAYRARVPRRRSWKEFLTVRIAVPVPVIAAAVVCVLLAFWLIRPAPNVPAREKSRRVNSVLVQLPGSPGYVTTLDTTGYQPVRDGAIRVISIKEEK